MKRFVIVSAAHYCSMVLLLLFLLWFVPDRFPGAPPLSGVNLVLSRVGVPTAAVAMILTFPSLFLADCLTAAVQSLAPYQAMLLTLPVSSVFWAWIFIFLYRVWIRRRIVNHDS
jgi:hypothetical protein